MKNIITLVVLFVVAVVTFNANAKTVSNINTRDAQACGEYLTKHPVDTIVEVFNLKDNAEVTRKVWLKGANILAVRNDTVYQTANVWEAISVKDLSIEQKEELLRGKQRVFNCESRYTHKVTGEIISKVAKAGYEVQQVERTDSIDERAKLVRELMGYFKPASNNFAAWTKYYTELYPSILDLVYPERAEARIAELKAKEAKKQAAKESVLFCGSYLLLCITGPAFGAYIAKKSKKV